MSCIINPFLFGSGDDPSSIADLHRWYKAGQGAYTDAGSTLATNGQTVQQWNDFSGNASHATQGTAGTRPVFTTGGQNGKPYLRFDGSKALAWDGTEIVGLYFTVFIVGKHDTSQSGWFTDGSSSSNNQNLHIGQSSTTVFRFSTFGASEDLSHTSGSLNIWACVLNQGAAQKTIWKNGSVATSGGSAAQLTANAGQQLGGNAPNFEGDLYEFIVYARQLDTTEIGSVFTYLNGDYAIY